MILNIFFLTIFGLSAQASPPPEAVIIKQQQEICEKSRTTEPNKDCSEEAIKKFMALRQSQWIKESTAQHEALKAQAAEDQDVYKESKLCKSTSGVICESPTGRRVQLETNCPRGWTTVNAKVDKDCSPEALRQLVKERAAMDPDARKKLEDHQKQELAAFTTVKNTEPAL